MPRTAAKVTQADLARALRAAAQVGGWAVKVGPDGTIVFVQEDESEKSSPKSAETAKLEIDEDIRL